MKTNQDTINLFLRLVHKAETNPTLKQAVLKAQRKLLNKISPRKNK